MSLARRVFPTSAIVLVSLFAPAASSAPRAAPEGSLLPVSGRGGCLSGFTGRFGCGLLRGFDGALISVSISPDGRYVYTSGIQSIHAFRRDRTTGMLTQLQGAAGCLVVDERVIPGHPPEGCASLKGVEFVAGPLVLAPEGRTAYVPVMPRSRGAASATVLSVSRDPRTGALHKSAEARLCVRIRSNPRCARLTDPSGFDAIVSGDGRNLYLTSNGATWAMRRDPVTGTLKQVARPAGCVQTTGHRPFRCSVARAGVIGAESPDGRYVYSIRDLSTPAWKRSSENSIAALRRDPKDGVLTALAGSEGCVSSAPHPGPCARARALLGISGVEVSADGGHLYAASTRFETAFDRPDNSAVTVFERSNATGALTQLPGAAGCISYSGELGCGKSRALFLIADLTLSPDDKHLYVSSWADGLLVVFRRDIKTGALSLLPGKAGCIGRSGKKRPGLTCTLAPALENPSDVEVSPDGRNVYALSTDEIVVFKRVQ